LIDADRSRITQVITNLVGNAIKFTSKGSIKVESRAYPDKNRLEIKISDTGGGIPIDILPRLFEKFVTKDHGEGNKKGSGLGLYISKAIVTAHNGELTATNNPEGGAAFLISMPITREVQQSAQK
jgi:signal transduction histidine kinase